MLVLSQYAEERYALDLIGDSAEGVGYLLKDRVADFAAFADAVRRVAEGGSALDPTSSRGCSGAAAAPTRSRSSRRASARSSSSWARADRTVASRRCSSSPRRGREARDEHLLQARDRPGAGGPPPGARGADVPAPLTMPETGKRVSWVELYLDLVFVLAVGRLAHVIVARARRCTASGSRSACSSRCGGPGSASPSSTTATAPTSRAQRLLFLAGSVPAGVAAVAIEPASKGDVAVFALSLAVTRLMLALAHVMARAGGTALRAADHPRDAWSRRRCSPSRSACPEPFRYVLWAVAIGDRVERDAGRGPRGDAQRAPRPRLRRCGRPTRRRRSTRTTSPSASACS